MNIIKEYELFKDEEGHPFLKIKREFSYETDVFNESIDIVRMMVELFNVHEFFVEHSYVLAFNYSNRLLGVSELGRDSDIQTPVAFKILFMELLLMGANKFVLIHNHPNNIVEPSIADINLGSKAKLGAEILELNFWNQIIICEEDFCDMLAEGYM